MWIGVWWAGLRVAVWIIHVGGKFRHDLLEKSLMIAVTGFRGLLNYFHYSYSFLFF